MPSREKSSGKCPFKNATYCSRLFEMVRIQPRFSGRGMNSETLFSKTSDSMTASCLSESLKPLLPKILIPLSRNGLWDAEMTTPARAPVVMVKYAMAGVGNTPMGQTSTPMDVMPAERAPSSISPEIRVSLPIITTGLRSPASSLMVTAMACPTRKAVNPSMGY